MTPILPDFRKAAAGFTVSGLANQSFAITLPTDGIVALTGPGTAMAAGAFTHNATGAIGPEGGPDAFGVGATIKVNGNQPAGAYSGSFEVSVSYN